MTKKKVYPEKLRERLSNLAFEIGEVIRKDSEKHGEALTVVLIGTFKQSLNEEGDVLTTVYPSTGTKNFFLALIDEARKQVEVQSGLYPD